MKKLLVGMVVVSLVLLHISTALAEDKMKFYVISHGGPADPFWGVVMKGAKDAGEEFDVDVTYLGPEKFSIQKLVDMVETAVADEPDGLAITITDAKALDEPVKAAIDKGIPVVAINVPDYRGFEEKIPYLAYVGADDYMVGVEAARRMLKEFAPETPKRGVVSIHEVGHAGLEARARGMIEVFTEAGIPIEKLATSPNASETYQAIDAYLTKNQDTDAIFCLGPLDAHPTLKLLEEKDLVGKVKLGAVDLSNIMIKAIKEDTLVFTVEQQQYLQGYLPISLLVLYNKYGLIPHDDILTGPAIVDKNNVEIVEEMVAKKYR
ncbi:sugar ABC transporter substrate-binding protein [candidate division KSB3 bacterium]|uniref:Sugar ABC transporter substrate-binding protein n=1 Tax=candidate division KSB3 bacterium TaxID=2044937 RepID=A0A2G6KC55_9BACT|nr:MAG: sugar ABC transporter substrate-binding protein [candidate division KSB3 bacterium]